MRALVFLGVLAGAGYASCVWLLVEHGTHPNSAWDLIVAPVAIGGLALLALFGCVIVDALIGGLDRRG